MNTSCNSGRNKLQWKQIYWRLWATATTMYCTTCKEFFRAVDFQKWYFHPEGIIYDSFSRTARYVWWLKQICTDALLHINMNELSHLKPEFIIKFLQQFKTESGLNTRGWKCKKHKIDINNQITNKLDITRLERNEDIINSACKLDT